jgi:hypothetical protein
MFRITQDPSSGSYIQYLTKIPDNGSIVQVFYVRSQCYGGIFWPVICVYAALHATYTHITGQNMPP